MTPQDLTILSFRPDAGALAAAPATRPLYFVNAWVDTLLIGGLSILAWAAFATFGRSIDEGRILPAALVLSLFVNWPHFSATVYRLYQARQHTRQFPLTAWGLPVVLGGAVFACFRLPQTVAPYFFMLYLLWSPYHYSGQTVGLTMVYARRSGFPIGRRERLALSTFVFAAFVYAVLHLRQSGFGKVFGMAITAPLFPAWMEWAAAAAMAAGGLAFAGLAALWCLREKRILAPIVLLPAAAHFVWFVPAAGLKAFAVVVPLFHSLQYLLVAGIVQLKYRADVIGDDRERLRLRAEALRWGARNVVGGMLLFLGMPLLFHGVGLSLPLAFGVVAAAVNIHHFFVDGVIWKLRDGATAAALTTSLAELGRAPAGAAAIAGSV
jgi:hypothetical protein